MLRLFGKCRLFHIQYFMENEIKIFLIYDGNGNQLLPKGKCM